MPGLGRVRLAEPLGGRAGAVARRDRRARAPRRHRRRAGRERRRERDRGARRARARLRADRRRRRTACAPAHTIVFLSTDGGAFGGLGAVRFAAHPPFHVVATIDLDAIGGRGAAADRDRRRHAALARRDARRDRRAAARRSRPGAARAAPSILGQLIDLGFPFTLYEQGPFVARGIPAVTLTTAGARPPAGVHRPQRRRSPPTRIGAIGRAAQQLIGSLDQGLELAQGTTTFVWAGDRFVRGWAIELLLFSLLVPFLVARRRSLRALPAAPHPAARRRSAACAAGSRSGSSSALAFYVLRALGAWPSGRRAAARTRRRAPPATGPCSRCSLLGAIVARSAGSSARQRLVPRRPVERRGAARRARPRRCSGSASSRCSFWQQTRTRCIFFVPRAARVALAAAGAQRRAAAPALVLLLLGAARAAR